MSAVTPLCFPNKITGREKFEKEFEKTSCRVVERIAQTIQETHVREIWDRVHASAWDPMAKNYTAEIPLTRFVPVDMLQAKQSFMEMARGEISAQPFQTWLIACDLPAEDLDLSYLQPFNQQIISAVIEKIQVVKARILSNVDYVPTFQIRLKAERAQEATVSGIKLSAWIEKFSTEQESKK